MTTGNHATRLGATVRSVALHTFSALTTRSTAVAAHIRHLMRSAPNALTVITSCPSPYLYRDNPSAASEHEHVEPAPQPKEEEDDTHQLSRISGCLVSSFNTVTLTPRPYVSFNIRLPSFTYSTIKAANGFTASGLKDARVADGFANRKFKRNDPHGPYGGSFLHGAVEADGRLKKGKGGTWWMRCRLSGGKCVEVGDHMVVVGKVLECGGYEGGEGTGLVYAEGEYRKVGQVVEGKGAAGGV